MSAFTEEKIFIKPIEDYTIGDRAEIVHKISADDVEAFAKLTGDYNPLHLNKEFARRTAYKKPVVYGMLSASFISTIIGMKIPGPGALWTSQSLEFLHQVYVGDELTIRAQVKQISIATRTLIIGIETYNQNGEKIISGEATARILEMEQDKEEKNVDSKKVVLVTGGSKGMGAAISKRLAADGYIVAINYNKSSERAIEVKKQIEADGGEAFVYQANVSDSKSVNEMIDKIENELGDICSLVHCAAPDNDAKKLQDLEWSDIQNQLDTQVRGFFNCCKKVADKMADLGLSGRIVAIGSIYADGTPPAYQTDYVVAKSALSALVKSIAVEYGPRGIAFNMVSPGMTETERILHVPEKAKLLAKMQAPSRNLQNVDEIADTVIFLLNQKTCALTGETIRVCGGVQMI